MYHPPLLTTTVSPFLTYPSCLTPLFTPTASPSHTTAASHSLTTPAASPSHSYPRCLTLPYHSCLILPYPSCLTLLTYCSFLTSLLTLAVSSSLNYLSCLVPLLTPAAKLFSFFTHLYDTMPLSSFDLEPSRVTSETGMWTAWSPPASATGAWFVSTTITQPKCCTWEKRQPLQELMTQSSFGRAMPMKDTKSRLQSHVQLPVSRVFVPYEETWTFHCSQNNHKKHSIALLTIVYNYEHLLFQVT